MVGSLSGDAAQHRALLSSLAPVLRAFFVRRLGQVADAEDLVQDTLIAIHTRRASYDPARPFGPWLFAVARYKLVDRHRKLRDEVAVDDFDTMIGEAAFDDRVGARIDIDDLLSTLPDKQAAAIRATRIEGLSIIECAARMGISESDVKISVHRGLKALAHRLGADA